MAFRRAGAALLVSVALLAACGRSQEPLQRPTAAPHSGHTATGSPPPTTPLRTGERFMELSMPEAYTPKAPDGGNDEYRCPR